PTHHRHYSLRTAVDIRPAARAAEIVRNLRGRLASASLIVAACAPAVHVPPAQVAAARELAPGVSYSQFTDSSGPWAINLVRVDLRRANIEIRGARAFDRLKGRERVSDMVRRVNATGVRVLAAVSAD